MDFQLAKEISDLADEIAQFLDPPDNMPDRAADALYKAAERREQRLDELCLKAMRQMVLDEAERTVRQHYDAVNRLVANAARKAGAA